MISKEVSCAIVIEGIGAAGETAPIYFSKRFSSRLRFFLGAGNEALTALPRSVETSVDPITSRIDVSSFSFELANNDLVSAILMRQGWVEDSTVSADVSASATTIPMTREVDGAVAGVTHAYVEDETIILGTWDAGLGAYTGCVRGVAHSTAARHSAGANVYLLPPYWRGREIALYTIDADDITIANSSAPPWRARWRGTLEEINTINNGANLQIDCKELIGGLLETTVYDAPIDIRDRLPLTFFDDGAVNPFDATITAAPDAYPIQTRKLSRWSTAGGIVFRVGNAAICADRAGGTSYVFGEFGLFLPDSGTVEEGPVHELLCVSKALDADPFYGGVSYTTGLDYPYHPLTCAIAILTSTASGVELIDTLAPDVVGAPFALDMARYLDTARWREMIEATPEVEIDQIFIGWEASERIFDTIIEKLLRPFGFYLTVNMDGQIGVARLQSMSVVEYCDASGNGLELLSPERGGRLEWQAGLSSAINEVTANVGGTPWSAPYPVTVRIGGNSRRTGRVSDGATWTFDLSAIARETALAYGEDQGQSATNALISTAVIGSLGLPRLAVGAPDGRLTGQSYDLGALFFIASGAPQDAWFVGPDGVRRVLPSSDELTTVTFALTIVGRAFNLDTHSYDLTGLLIGYRTQALARLRAPSMRIVGWDTDVTLIGPETPDFNIAIAEPDATMFRAGDQVQIVRSDGTLWEAGTGIIASTPTTESMEFDVYPWIGNPVDATAPRYVRLAPSSMYSNTDLVACFARPWTYLGDEMGRITDTDDDLVQGDRYG